MPELLKERMQAARALAGFLATPTGRRVFATNGYHSGKDVLLAISEEPIESVLNRVTTYSPPVVVAVWFEEEKQLDFVELSPGQERAFLKGDQFGGHATIGMLLRLMDTEKKKSITFRLTEWNTYMAKGFDRTLAGIA